MGNIYQESNFKPETIQNGGKGPAAGLFQWENYNTQSSRWKAMSDHAASLGKHWTDLGAQLDYANKEMTTTEKWMWTSKPAHSEYYSVKSLDEFKSLTDPVKAAEAFENHFERAGKPAMKTRTEKAIEYYNTYSGSTYTGTSPDFNSSSSTGTTSESSSSSGFDLGGIIDKFLSGAFNFVAKKIGGTVGGIISTIFGGSQENQQTSTNNTWATGSSGTAAVSGELANGFPFYTQYDERWASVPYGNGTIKSSGCGPTSMAMVMQSYGNNVTPVDTSNWSLEHGYRINGQGTSWDFFKAIGNTAGLTTTQFNSKDQVKEYLRDGVPVIASMTPGEFTKGGHFLVLSSLKGDSITVNDPASSERTKKLYNADYVLGQTKQFWAVSKDGKGSINTTGTGSSPMVTTDEAVNNIAASGSGLVRSYDFTKNTRGGASEVIDLSGVTNTTTSRTVSTKSTGNDVNSKLDKLIELISLIVTNTTNNAVLPSLVELMKQFIQISSAINKNGSSNNPRSEDIRNDINQQISAMQAKLERIAQTV